MPVHPHPPRHHPELAAADAAPAFLTRPAGGLPDLAPPHPGRGRWLRVTRRSPCPVCGRGDWCGLAADGGAVACMRVEAGAERRLPNGAWLHRLGAGGASGGVVPPSLPPADDPAAAAARLERLMGRYRAAATPARLARLAEVLGLSSAWPLGQLGVGWSHFHPGHAFPMLDVTRRLTGVQVRRADGAKRQLRGSRLGLFLPRGLARMPRDVPLVICEGASDTTACLDLADRHRAALGDLRLDELMPWRPVGRASCAGGHALLIDLILGLHPDRHVDLVVLADVDAAGLRGAHELAERLRAEAKSVRVLVPGVAGAKDLRARTAAGLTPADFAAALGF